MTDHSQATSPAPDLTARILQGMKDAVMLTDLTGGILDINPAFERLYGYPREQAIGKPASILKSGRHDMTFFHHLWQAVRRGMTWEGNIYNKRKDGSIIMVEETIVPLFDADGEVEYYLATMRENIIQSWQSEKGHKPMPQKDLMTTTLAHDLSNLITPLLGDAEVARSKYKTGANPGDELDRVCRNGSRAKELLRQVLAFCRHDYNEKKDPVSLGHIVKDVISIIEPDFPDNIKIQTEFQHKSAVVYGDSVQLHQVLMNLCTNSLKALQDDGGCLKISLEHLVVNNNSPYLGDFRKGEYVKLSVTDDGIGMSADGVRRAFDPYYSTRDDRGEGEGHGLGLSIVRKIVEGHLGKVYLKSSPGTGCAVDVILPSGAPQGITETQQIPISVVPVKTGAILFVDDEHSIRQMGKNMLEYVGYSVVGFSGANEALDVFVSRPNEFDLVITDLLISVTAGADFIQKIRKIRSDIPIIFVTSPDDQLPMESVDKLGRSKVLEKPFSSEELLDAVFHLGIE